MAKEVRVKGEEAVSDNGEEDGIIIRPRRKVSVASGIKGAEKNPAMVIPCDCGIDSWTPDLPLTRIDERGRKRVVLYF